MKGLPLAYSKDMQDDKPPVFDAPRLLELSLAAMTGMVATGVRCRPDAQAAGSGYSTATDLADWLVREATAVPRGASHHRRRGAMAESRGVALDALSLDELAAIDSRIDERVFAALSVDASVAARASYGGTAPDQVRQRVAEARSELGIDE